MKRKDNFLNQRNGKTSTKTEKYSDYQGAEENSDGMSLQSFGAHNVLGSYSISFGISSDDLLMIITHFLQGVDSKDSLSPTKNTINRLSLRSLSSLTSFGNSKAFVNKVYLDGLKLTVGATSDMSFLPGHPDYPTLEQSSKFEPGIVYDCVSCSSMFRTEKDFRVHAERCQQASISFCCSACFFRATEQESIELHLEQVHQRPVNRYKCKKCPSSFRKPIGLKKHMEVKHSETARFQCSFCGKFMYNKNDLDGHINQHKGIKPHCCSYCNKAFCYKSSMGSHEKLCSLRWPKQT
ncbi:zinc finger protein Gfi-1b-like [Physella acuta]|uniref:zinc finger protein Gfi-1b-like n=1 Tax=Physella acuta TaxID=109671 RepID=UPI0027DADDF2|nr:zinc finger protein Gfi-1b-like [Physella acuta]